MSRPQPWHDASIEWWRAYRAVVAEWLDAHQDRPNTVVRRCLALADMNIARLEESA